MDGMSQMDGIGLVTRAIGSMLPIALLLLGAAPVWAEPPAVIGWQEVATVRPLAGPAATLRVTARIDTGAETSSLDARDLVVFERQGIEWASFLVRTDDGEHRVRAEVVRYATIRRAGADRQRRPVVEMEVCIGGRTARAEVTLTDRGSQDTRMLVGRAFLAGRFLVDAGRTEQAPDACAKP